MGQKILAINLGATSTKIAYWEDERCLFSDNISHDASDLQKFPEILAQYPYRLQAVRNFIEQYKISKSALDAVVSRGGHTHPIPSGIYQINDSMLAEIRSGRFGRHPCDIGCFIASELCRETHALPLIVDPPVTDEFDDIARISGLNGVNRVSRFHALNQKAVAREAAADLGRPYSSLNLIVVHLGGGISVCAHRQGRMVDANNALEGEGPFSANRTGGLCALDVVNLCEKYTPQRVHKRINGSGGLVSYLGTSDLREVEARIDNGDKEALCYFNGMCYQVAKEIGAMAAVLCGKMDGIVLTGGMANSQRLVQTIKNYVSFLAPIYVYPGENEMKSLALGAMRALRGECEIIHFQTEV